MESIPSRHALSMMSIGSPPHWPACFHKQGDQFGSSVLLPVRTQEDYVILHRIFSMTHHSLHHHHHFYHFYPYLGKRLPVYKSGSWLDVNVVSGTSVWSSTKLNFPREMFVIRPQSRVAGYCFPCLLPFDPKSYGGSSCRITNRRTNSARVLVLEYARP